MNQSIITSLVIIIALFFGVGFIDKYNEATENYRILKITNTEECSSLGGIVETVCMAQVKSCVVPYKDAGVHCSSSADCSGRCIYLGKSPKQLGDEVQGTCENANDPCGCWDLVSGDEIIASGCSD